MAVISNDGFVYRWDMVNFTKKGEGLIDRNCDFRASVFWNPPFNALDVVTNIHNYKEIVKDDSKVFTVGSESGKALFRVYNHKED